MISSDAIMCYACGHRLQAEAPPAADESGEAEVPCPSCGTMISADAIMCYACGHRMASEDSKGRKEAAPTVKKVLKKKII
jgi:predicted RNA-binding Zn-ribbon protein involved in translation (DUF1610 family)